MAAKRSLKGFIDVAVRFSPDDTEAVRMLKDLIAAFGVAGTAAVCGVTEIAIKEAAFGRKTNGVGMWTRRAIWLTWALLIHPERAETLLDLVAWGRLCEPLDKALPPARKVRALPTRYGIAGPRRSRELKRKHQASQKAWKANEK